ncbi:hypothetical protein FHG87_021243 [Trinorchestia longiramus]|nr:hypothetical protein FHG87_021243 [Trinorchestia longiramus]
MVSSLRRSREDDGRVHGRVRTRNLSARSRDLIHNTGHRPLDHGGYNLQSLHDSSEGTGNQQMTRQQPPQTEGKQPHSNDAHFHPEEESIRESPTVEAILSADEKNESSLQLLPKPGDDSPSSGGTEAVIQSSSRIENLTSS